MKTFTEVDENRRINDFIRLFGRLIKEGCKNKKTICLQLSSGFDTRSVASVLLNLNIDFDVISSNFSIKPVIDFSFAKTFCDTYNKILFRHNYKDKTMFMNGFYELCKETSDYDIVLSGLMMTEYINRYNFKARYCFKKYQDDTLFYYHFPLYDKIMKDFGNLFLPILNVSLLNILRYIPYEYCKNSIIQKRIIKYYFKELL